MEERLVTRAQVVQSRLAVGRRDVADQSRFHHAARRPRQHGERAQVGHEHHVGFLAAHEPVDRAAVESDVAFQRAFDLRDRNGHALVYAQNVHERQAHEAYGALFDGAQHVAFGHGLPFTVR